MIIINSNLYLLSLLGLRLHPHHARAHGALREADRKSLFIESIVFY